MYYKVGEPVFVCEMMLRATWSGTQRFKIEEKVGLVIEKYNTPQLQKQMIYTPNSITENVMSTTYSSRTHRHIDDLIFSPRAFASYDIQYRNYIEKYQTPKSGRWHKYYVVMVGDEKKIYMYKDLKKMHNQ